MSCSLCEYKTVGSKSMNRHKRTKHLGGTIYYCDTCGFKSFYRQSIKLHINGRHKNSNARVKSIDCTQCQTNVEHDRCYANQCKKSYPKGTQQLCTSCNYTTTKAAYFKNHQKLNHGPDSDISKVVTCTQCEFQTLNPKTMKYHKRAQHLGETRYYCDICELKSFYNHCVRLHIVSKHKETNARVKRVNCTQCQNNVEHKCQANLQNKS